MPKRLDRKRIPGTYIAEFFETSSDIRSELLVLHKDGTAARYISSAIGSFGSNQNGNGVELTPSYGTWKLNHHKDAVKVVVFDWYNMPASFSSDPSDPAAQVYATETDRITYTIKFSHSHHHKYQKAEANELLYGILISTAQDPLNPATPNAGVADLNTYNNPSLALASQEYLEDNNFVDPSANPLARNNIIFRRVNVDKKFEYPDRP